MRNLRQLVSLQVGRGLAAVMVVGHHTIFDQPVSWDFALTECDAKKTETELWRTCNQNTAPAVIDWR
jgi:peptidoglycan/LPS O-acetylase OafA/YrhL